MKQFLDHEIGHHRDPAVSHLIAKLGWEAYGLYMAIMDTLAEQPSGVYPMMHLPALAFSLHADEGIIKGVICDYGLFRIGCAEQQEQEEDQQEYFWSDDILQQLKQANKLSERNKKAANSRWKKSDNNTDDMQVQCTTDADVMHTQCTRNADAMHTQCTCNADAMHTQCTCNAGLSEKEKEAPFPHEKEKKISPHTPLLRKEKVSPFPKKEKNPTGGESFFFEKEFFQGACTREGGGDQPTDPVEIQEKIRKLQEAIGSGDLPARDHNEAVEKLSELKNLISKEKEKISAEKEKESNGNGNALVLVPPQANPKPVNHDPPLHFKLKQAFLEFYRDKSDHDYYFSAKDAGALSQLIKKLKFLISSKQMIPTDELVMDSWNILLPGIRDKWILDNLSLSNINSKFNEIVNQLNPKNDRPINSVSDAYRADVARRLAGGVVS